jgi:alkyl hydroperoxide reductase subunit AhpF
MAVLEEFIRNQVRERFSRLQRPVRLILFTQGQGGVPECEMCADTRELAQEVSSLSDKIHLEIRDFVADAALAEKMRVEKIPALAVMAEEPALKDYGIRLFGIPAGFEFTSLIEDILLVSRGEAGLSPRTMSQIGQIRTPVHIQVFTAPT